MTSKRNVKAQLKRARLRSEPFKVAVGDESIEGTLTAVPFLRWQELQSSHPPRPGNGLDEGWGYSCAETWPDMVRACVSSPEMDDEDWDMFFGAVRAGDLTRLAMQVISLNVTPGVVDVPKSPSTSLETEPLSSD